jgi:hypothetical protein
VAPPLINVGILVQSPVWAAISKQTTEMLRRYADLAAIGSPRGRRALAAARGARDAYLHEGRWGPVEAFVSAWLGIRRRRRDHAEAALDALLDANLDDPGVRFSWLWDGGVLGTLRTRVVADARFHRPLRDSQIGGRAIAMLDDPLRTEEPDSGTLLDVLADKPAPSLLLSEGFEDPRLERVMALFTAQERAVVLVQALRGVSWADAGVAAGYTAEVGGAVRRKRAIVARRVLQRLEARPRSEPHAIQATSVISWGGGRAAAACSASP